MSFLFQGSTGSKPSEWTSHSGWISTSGDQLGLRLQLWECDLRCPLSSRSKEVQRQGRGWWGLQGRLVWRWHILVSQPWYSCIARTDGSEELHQSLWHQTTHLTQQALQAWAYKRSPCTRWDPPALFVSEEEAKWGLDSAFFLPSSYWFQMCSRLPSMSS